MSLKLNPNRDISSSPLTIHKTMNASGYRTLKYGEHERQRVSIFDHIPPFSEQTKLAPLIFIHGGAWRDPSNTDKDILKLSKSLNKMIPLCSVDYRLSPEVKHPVYMEDVIKGIKLCMRELQAHKVCLMGHSVGAMLSLQCLSEQGIDVEQLYLLEGIFDIVELIKEYPSYKSFVDEAHLESDYITGSPMFTIDELKKVSKIHIFQSYEDELLSLEQTHWLCSQLEAVKCEYGLYVGDLGKHNDVYENEKVAEYIDKNYH